MSLVEAIRAYIGEMIRLSGPGMKVLLMDKETTAIVSCAYAQSEMMQQEVYLFQRIDGQVKRDPVKHLKCVAFVRATPENVALVVQELRNPYYGQYFVFFSNVISKSDLKQLAEADDFEVVREIAELYADFVPLCPHLFTVNLPFCYQGLQWSPTALKRSVCALASVLLALRRSVTIRYQASSDAARVVADSLRSLMTRESVLFQSSGSASPNETLLLILDRRFDAITPLLNQWTYQAMVHELFGIRNNRVNMESAPSVGADMREIILNPMQDDFYATNMYASFGEIAQNIKEMMDEFQKKAKTHQKLESIADMKIFVEQYPQFKRMSGAVAKHVTLISELSRLATDYNLLEVSELEQHLACHADHSYSLQNIRRLLNHEKTSDLDATRLVMLYALRFESHPSSDLRGLVNLLRKRGVPEKYYRAVYDVVEFGGLKWRGIDPSADIDPIKITKKFIQDLKGVENIYTQHKPVLSELLGELAKNRLKESSYPYASGCSAPVRLQEVIVFIFGGATYEESLAVYNFSQNFPLKVILGGTAMHNGRSFIEEVINATQGASAIGAARHHLS
ncbi:vacuolar protein sorting associated protein 45 [Trichuris trichiura]|uniref:Vacuolar protein sorting-associated protein 45 n=1 Tax=Trichuris trichiura TaxID=36087 RepID=A0A077ZBB2_TRITR|nr:vacuolar protein sorting associated protein 45 [Trichuris trichiura]